MSDEAGLGESRGMTHPRDSLGVGRSPLRTDPANPLVTARMLGSDACLAFNPAVCREGDRLLMAVRADLGVVGDPNITGSRIDFLSSDDGVVWTRDGRPSIDRAAAIDLLEPLEPHRDLEREVWRIYDPRLVSFEDRTGRWSEDETILLSFALDTTHGLRSGLAKAVDDRWQAISLSAPDSRNHVVFPESIDGMVARLERPMPSYGGEAFGAGRSAIWVARSPDFRHWSGPRLVCDPSDFEGAAGARVLKIGPGAQPVRCEAGWLCIIHVVTHDDGAQPRGWEPEWTKRYSAHGMVLCADDPSRVVAIGGSPLLRQESDEAGFRHGVVFPTSAIAHENGRLDVYYGSNDTTVCRASASIEEVVEFVLSGAR